MTDPLPRVGTCSAGQGGRPLVYLEAFGRKTYLRPGDARALAALLGTRADLAEAAEVLRNE